MAERLDPSIFAIGRICGSEEDAIAFCREHGLIPAPLSHAPNARIGEFWGICRDMRFNAKQPNCNGRVTTVTRMFKNGPKPQYRCLVCRKQLSQQHGRAAIGGAAKGTWFASLDTAGRPNCKISKRAVLWILYAMVKEMSIKSTIELTAGDLPLEKVTVVDWRNFARELMQAALQEAPRMGGEGQVVQVGVSLFRGRRKRNRDRVLPGDDSPGRRPSYHEERGDGPWVFGLLHGGTGELRLFHVQQRDAATFMPIIVANVLPGTTIWSDECEAYDGIPLCRDLAQNGGGRMGYIYQSVNRSVEFVNSVTGANTQRLTREWYRCKLQLMRLNRGTSPALLPGHLASFWWASQNGQAKCADPFLRLVELIRYRYPQD